MNTFNIKLLILSFGIIFSFQTTLYSQNKNIEIMKKFDIETFKKNKIGIHYQFETEEAFVLQGEEEHCYYEQIEYKKNPFGDNIRYYKDSLTPMYAVRKCYNFGIGVMREYDRVGNVTKETDWDAPFKFSLDDLRKKIMAEYKVDIFINNIPYVYVSRSTNPIPLYQITIPVKGYPDGFPGGGKTMNIDGVTGEGIAETMPDGSNRIIKQPKQEEEKGNKKFWDMFFE